MVSAFNKLQMPPVHDSLSSSRLDFWCEPQTQRRDVNASVDCDVANTILRFMDATGQTNTGYNINYIFICTDSNGTETVRMIIISVKIIY